MFVPDGFTMFGGQSLTENWDNLDAWDTNTITFRAAFPPGGTATVSGNFYTYSTLPTDGGPIVSQDLGSVDDFVFEGSLEISTISSYRGTAIAAVFDSASAPDGALVGVYLTDNNGLSSVARAVVHVKSSSTDIVFDTADSANVSTTYSIDFSITRTGSTIDYDITGDITLSGSVSMGETLDTICAQTDRVSGFTPLTNMKVGPLTLQY